MKITRVYSRRLKIAVYRLDFRVEGRRFRLSFRTQNDAVAALDKLRERALSLSTVALPAVTELIYGWNSDIDALPRIGAVYMIVPEPILRNILYVGNTANLWARLRTKRHPWHVIKREHPNAWITYYPVEHPEMRYTIERQMIENAQPPFNIACKGDGPPETIDWEAWLREYEKREAQR